MKKKLDEQVSIIPNSTLTSPKTIIEIPTKSFVDSLHENSRNRQDLSSVVRFKESPGNYLKQFVGNDIYILTNYDKILIKDTTIIKFPNSSEELLQNWFVKCNDRKCPRKFQNFI